MYLEDADMLSERLVEYLFGLTVRGEAKWVKHDPAIEMRQEHLPAHLIHLQAILPVDYPARVQARFVTPVSQLSATHLWFVFSEHHFGFKAGHDESEIEALHAEAKSCATADKDRLRSLIMSITGE